MSKTTQAIYHSCSFSLLALKLGVTLLCAISLWPSNSMAEEENAVDALSSATKLYTEQQTTGHPRSLAGIIEVGSRIHKDKLSARASTAFKEVEKHILTPEEIVEYTDRCSLNNEVDACYSLGIHHLSLVLEHRADLQRNVEYSLQYLEQSCKLNHQNACMQLGLAYGSFGTFFINGEYVGQDVIRAHEYFKRGYNLSDPYSTAQLGMMNYQGMLGKINKPLGLSLLKESCQMAQNAPQKIKDVDPNVAMGCFKYGLISLLPNNENSEIPKQVQEEATAYIQKACELKYARACFFLAQTNAEYTKDTKAAQNYYKSACYAGIGSACVIAAGYENDQQNYQEATKLVKQGCSFYHPDSCALYASNLVEGIGVDKANVQKGFELSIKSCQAGSAIGCFYTANLYKNSIIGKNEKQQDNLAKSKEYYQKACDLKHEPSCQALKNLTE